MKFCDLCEEEAIATTLLKSVHEAVPQALCLAHVTQRKAYLDNILVPYTATSIIETEVSVQELLSDTSTQLQDSDRLNRGLQLEISRLRTALNNVDQERQALRVSEQKMKERAELSELALTRWTGLSLEDSLKRLEVEELASVEAGSDPNGPAAVVQGG